jgi:alpha-L-rhamnosidase
LEGHIRGPGLPRFRLDLTVPAGSTAGVHVPSTVGRRAADRDAERSRTGEGEAVYEVGSGDWTFTTSLTRT